MNQQQTNFKELFQNRLIAALRDAGVADHGRGVWLADRMGVTPKAAGKWINGESMPSQDKWSELAKHLHKPKSYFYEDTVLLSNAGSVNESSAIYASNSGSASDAADAIRKYKPFVDDLVSDLPYEELLKFYGKVEMLVEQAVANSRKQKR